MTSMCLRGARHVRAPGLSSALRAAALVAALIGFGHAAAADGSRGALCTGDEAARCATPVGLSRPGVELELAPDWAPAAFRGLSCSRCNSATQFCVLNPIRYEYACAPLGTVACISAERTHWCPPSRGCWAGYCR